MRWCRFQVKDKVAYGIVEGERVREVRGSPFGRHYRTSKTHRLAAVKLLVPCWPTGFYAAGGPNYEDHITWVNSHFNRNFKRPTAPHVGYRANNALIAQGEPIVYPKNAKDLHYEGELVVVVGKKLKRASEAEALAGVLGYTIGNDVSERVWQFGDDTWWRAKNSDTFKPMGPWIETDLKVDKAVTTVRLNGKVATSFRTGEFIFGVGQYLSAMSHHLTLFPGDVLWMGTAGATLPPIKAGDTVEIEITGIGVLRNPVVAEK